MSKPCKICSAETNNGFNINFELVPICESCATSIFIQQAKFYSETVVAKFTQRLPKCQKCGIVLAKAGGFINCTRYADCPMQVILTKLLEK